MSLWENQEWNLYWKKIYFSDRMCIEDYFIWRHA